MRFIPTHQLKTGMRIARPIFNRKGVLLYDRNSLLTEQGITSIRNFGLIGIYILEPAEPLPPITEEDREFERFQTVSVFTLQEVLSDIQNGKNPKKLYSLAAEILGTFGSYNGKITFMQNLRSVEDNVYKHSLNTAILAAAISGKMNFRMSQQQNIVLAALLHDLGSLALPAVILRKPVKDISGEEKILIGQYRENGYRQIHEVCDVDAPVLRYISQLIHEVKDLVIGKPEKDNWLGQATQQLSPEVEILKVAYTYDLLTAMKYGEEPSSDILAYRFLRHPRNRMNQQVVTALTWAIKIVPVGCSVEFENHKKGIVLTENEDDILRPYVLSFEDNKIYNLADGKVYYDYQIKDVLKSLDNRHIMIDTYKEYLKNQKK